MRILFIITGLSNSGAEKQLYLLIKGLISSHKVRVINFTGGFFEQKIRDLGVNVVTTGLNPLKILRVMHQEIRDFLPDLVHSWLPHANILAKFARFLGVFRVKLVCCMRVKETKYLLFNVFERVLDWKSELNIVNSGAISGYLKRFFGFSGCKFRIIFNGF